MLNKLITTKNTLFLVMGGSLFSLAAALFAEVALSLEPCILCIYQRVPFALVFLIAGGALVLRRGGDRVVALCGFAFLVNSGIAFYHSGVELHWWKSAVEGCSVPALGNTEQSILENILSAPTGNCSEIPWADPILGLSMANYNVVLCLGLFAVCMVSIFRERRV